MSEPADVDVTAEHLLAEFDWEPADLAEAVPELTAGLIGATARLLAVVTYRDAITLGTREFPRGTTTQSTALALLPVDCDQQDQRFPVGRGRRIRQLGTRR